MHIQFWGATEEVTGSCCLITTGKYSILLDCGLFQGTKKDESRNSTPFPFDAKKIDAVILSHAHIDHSGRLPLLLKAGFKGRIFTHMASLDLCNILLQDSAFLNEKDVETENRKRIRKGLKAIEPLYNRQDARKVIRKFKGLVYDKKYDLLPGISFRLRDAGHILGSSIVELWFTEGGQTKKIAFSGDLGHSEIPILRDPCLIDDADIVIMESTYGDRYHKDIQSTFTEIQEIFVSASKAGGNILIPAFAVGRSQELLYLFSKYHTEWKLGNWQVFLDSPMAIAATDVYLKHKNLYDKEAATLIKGKNADQIYPGLHISHTANQSMQLNKIKSGAIIMAGSGMCTGGRIRHHIKHNIWRRDCNIIFTGFQARGTLGRLLVDGAQKIRLWGETINVNAKVHTIGGLSAHADQNELLRWYRHFKNNPDLILIHGEKKSIQALSEKINSSNCIIPQYGDDVVI